MNGLLARQCPNKLSATGAGGQSRPQGQQNYTYGKVNHMTTEEAQHAQDVVLGMFLASSHPAIVFLFRSIAFLYIIIICSKASAAHNNHEADHAC
jgi:hypothetical protein